jgi:hypothetical protein
VRPATLAAAHGLAPAPVVAPEVSLVNAPSDTPFINESFSKLDLLLPLSFILVTAIPDVYSPF